MQQVIMCFYLFLGSVIYIISVYLCTTYTSIYNYLVLWSFFFYILHVYHSTPFQFYGLSFICSGCICALPGQHSTTLLFSDLSLSIHYLCIILFLYGSVVCHSFVVDVSEHYLYIILPMFGSVIFHFLHTTCVSFYYFMALWSVIHLLWMYLFSILLLYCSLVFFFLHTTCV